MKINCCSGCPILEKKGINEKVNTEVNMNNYREKKEMFENELDDRDE